VTRRLLLWSGIFLAGALAGFLAAWILAAVRHKDTFQTTAAREDVILNFSATIDGSGRFIFTPDQAWYEHGRWSPPTKVVFNDTPWPDLAQPPPGWLELAPALDLRNAKLVMRKGRDIVALEPTEQGFELLFADTQMGAAKYEVTISIPRK